MTRLFGTNGVRGIVGKTIGPDLALRLGKAFGSWLYAGETIAMGTDGRDSKDMLACAFAAGVQSTGVHVVQLGIVPSPAVQLFVRDNGLAAGAIITASHNPPEWNGIKLIAPDGTEASPADEAAVETLHLQENFRNMDWNQVGTLNHADDAADRYIAAVLAQVDVNAIRAAGLHVVLDPGGGAGCVTAPKLMEALGVTVVPLHCDLDSAFSGRPSEPSPVNASKCMAAVKKHRADLGVLQDGDADRSIFVDENGGYAWGDQSLALGAKWELKRHPNGSTVCTAISSSSCVQDAVNDSGGHLISTMVGSPIVAREMLRTGAVFGGEDNGGLIFSRHQFCRDGLMAAAFFLELIATTGRSFSDLLSEIPRYALVKDKVEVDDDQKQEVLARFHDAVTQLEGIQKVDTRDGVKAYLTHGWVLVRPSGTEPIFRVQAEAKLIEEAEALVQRFSTILIGVRDEPLLATSL